MSKQLVKCNQGGKPSPKCRKCGFATPHEPSSCQKECSKSHKCEYGRKVTCQCVLVVPESEPLRPHYAGTDSIPFWQRVNSFKGHDHATLYELGCVLQNIEAMALRFLREFEEKRK